MLDRTINSALTQIWRDRETGWEFAWAVLVLREIEIPKQSTRPRFKRRELPRLIQEALSGGPKGHAEIAAYVASQRPDIVPKIVGRRVQGMLCRMKAKGLVRRDGWVWGLRD